MKCKLCERVSEDDLCQYHLDAKAALDEAYQYWVEAYGSLERDEYLKRVAKNPETGVWVAEVANMMLGSG